MTDQPEQHLDVLHDHYKESFSYIRERERQQDRLFLTLIGLFALLFFETQYPRSFGGGFGSGRRLGRGGGPRRLAPAALLSASWVLTLAIVLRYCQVSINVERQDSTGEVIVHQGDHHAFLFGSRNGYTERRPRRGPKIRPKLTRVPVWI